MGGQYPDLAPAITSLRTWDYTVSAASIPMSLAHYYGMLYMQKGEAPTRLSYMERAQYFGQASPDAERLQIFSEAVNQLTEDFGSWETPWGEINRFQRLDGAIDAGFDDEQPSLPVGLASALAAYGALQRKNTKRMYGYRGNSFVAVVEFGEKVQAKSLLAGGQSGDRDSPHFFDQAQRYVDVQFKDVPYYREDVEKRAKETYHPGERK